MLEHSNNINENENVCILIVKNPEKPLSEDTLLYKQRDFANGSHLYG